MKEASGEASMTGITIALIAIVAVIATPIITSVIGSTAYSACCQSNGGTMTDGQCSITGMTRQNYKTYCP